MRYPYSLIISCLVLLNAHLFSLTLEITSEDHKALHNYFQLMMNQSEGGFVLFGAKPISAEGYYSKYSSLDGNYHYVTPLVEQSEVIRSGLEAWHRLSKNQECPSIAIVNFDKITDYDIWHSVIWIHKKTFLQVVNENLPLFQQVLGPKVTAEGLLETLINQESSLVSLLNGNKALTGIVLGFGTQNSIVHSRLEVIHEHIFQPETVPLASRVERTSISHGYYPGFFNREITNPVELQPSFGYSTLLDEHNSLRSTIHTTRSYRSNGPFPIFGYIESEESNRLLTKLEWAQKKTIALLNSPTFMEDILSLLFGKKTHLKVVKSTTQKSSPAVATAKEVAQLIWNKLLSHDPDYVSQVIDGMTSADSNSLSLSSIEANKDIQAYHTIRSQVEDPLLKSQEDAQLSNLFVTDMHSLVKGKLFYKVIQTGTGKELGKSSAEILMNCTFTSPSTTQNRLKVSTEDLVKGLRMAMFGMKEGEIREVYIHSDYAYGNHSNFPPCTPLMRLSHYSLYPEPTQGCMRNSFVSI